MEYKDVRLIDSSKTLFSLANEFPDVLRLTDAIEDAKDSEDLLSRLKTIPSYIKEFSLDRETPEYIRYKLVARMCDNIYYLVVYKENNMK